MNLPLLANLLLTSAATVRNNSSQGTCSIDTWPTVLLVSSDGRLLTITLHFRTSYSFARPPLCINGEASIIAHPLPCYGLPSALHRGSFFTNYRRLYIAFKCQGTLLHIRDNDKEKKKKLETLLMLLLERSKANRIANKHKRSIKYKDFGLYIFQN